MKIGIAFSLPSWRNSVPKFIDTVYSLHLFVSLPGTGGHKKREDSQCYEGSPLTVSLPES